MSQITQINPEALNIASQMILKEIDLTGPDTERKAKLAKFETDWKVLTGASDMKSARFVGEVAADDGTALTGVFSYDNAGTYVGLVSALGYNYKAEVLEETGVIYITSLISHLEPVALYDVEGTAYNKRNKESLEAYKTNLEALGVNPDNGFQVPFRIGLLQKVFCIIQKIGTQYNTMLVFLLC